MQRLVRLVHVTESSEWMPVPGVAVQWRLGCWVESDHATTAASMLSAFGAQRANFDPSPVRTLDNLWAALKKFTPTLRAATIHDGIREYQAQTEEA